MSATAAAIDPILLELRGFTLTDVLEVVLGHADRVTSALAGVWPDQFGAAGPEVVADPVVSDAEVAVAREQLAMEPASLAGVCAYPDRAAMVLAWLTRPASEVKIAALATEPVLGATLLVDCGAQRVAVPAALTLATLAAATGLLADQAATSPQAHHRLQALTQWRTKRLSMGRTAGPVTTEIADDAAAAEARWLDQPADTDPGTGVHAESDDPGHRVVEPLILRGSRHVTVTVSGLGSGDLSRALSWAEARLTAENHTADNDGFSDNEAPTKVVIYGGPAILAYQEVTDTVRLHLEELAEILADALGDQALFASFLAELCPPRRDVTLLVFDVLDAWSVWRDRGFITLPGDPELYPVHVDDQPDDLVWRRAAVWEPIEQILFDAALPESVDWPVARLAADTGDAALFAGDNGTAVLVRRNPDVLVSVFFGDADLLGMSRDGLYGFADGLLATVGRQPVISAHLRLGRGTPLHLILRLLTERTPEDHDGLRFGVAMDADRGVVEIGLGPDTMERFQGDGRDGHSLLGGMLYEAVARLRAARDEDPGSPADEFRVAWDSCPPVMIFTVSESITPVMPQPDTLPRGPHLRLRALHAVAAALRERDLPVGTVTGEQARDVCRDHLLPALEEVLQARIQICQPDLLTHTLRSLNAAHATRYSEQLTLTRSLAGPFADNWIEHALHAQEGAAATRPLEVLFELILAHPPRGQRPVDALEVADLAALADLLLTVVTLTRGADRNLHDLTIHIADSGHFAFDDDTDLTSADITGIGFDQQAYSRAHREQQAALARSTSPEEPLVPQHMPIDEASQPPLPFTSLREVADAGLVQADDLLRASSGTTLDAIRAVLHVACDWPVVDGFSQVEPTALTSEAAAWSGLPATEIDAALHLLQLTGEDLALLDPATIADLEDRAHRLALRPLPMVDGQLLIAPWLAHNALRVYATYLDDSRLPYPRQTLPDGVEHLMQQRRQQQNNQLEDDVHTVVTDLGLPHHFRFHEGDAATAGIPDLPGEIDLLIADPEHDRLWVCEVKDPQASYSPLAIFRHIRRFTKRNGHVDKLLNKVGVISNHSAAAAIACSEASSRPWRVVPLMVTRWVEPAAFITNPRVSFTEINQLASVLKAHNDPVPATAATTH